MYELYFYQQLISTTNRTSISILQHQDIAYRDFLIHSHSLNHLKRLYEDKN